MSIGGYTQEIEALQGWVAELQRSADELTMEQPTPMVEALEKLRISLEELQVLDEELRQQNLELKAAQQELEGERQRFPFRCRGGPGYWALLGTS